jgi:hypothetical protein
MCRLLIALVLVLDVSQAAGFQCPPLSHVMDNASVVFIGRAHELVRQGAVNASGPEIMGSPRRYDLLRFAVLEPLKGDIPTSVELLCAADDERCRPGDGTRLLVVALPGPVISEAPQTLLCNVGYLEPVPGAQTPDASLMRSLIEKLRMNRREKR